MSLTEKIAINYVTNLAATEEMEKQISAAGGDRQRCGVPRHQGEEKIA